MFRVLQFILNCVLDFMKMLFSVQVDNGLSLGLLFCICFILFPMLIRIVIFLKRDALEEINASYEDGKFDGIFHKEYEPKHAPAGRHSSEYFRRQKQLRRYK